MGKMGNKRINQAFPFLLIGFLFLAVGVGTGAAGNHQGNFGHDHFDYLSPLPGAVYVSPGTTIAVRGGGLSGAALLSALTVEVWSAANGRMTGQLLLAGDGETVIFRPDHAFQENEQVRVKLAAGEAAFDYFFRTGQNPDPKQGAFSESLFSEMPSRGSKSGITAEPYKTAPADLPRFSVTAGPGQPGEGSIFITPTVIAEDGSRTGFLMIVDDQGEPIFFERLENAVAFDLKTQPNGLLTYYDTSKTHFLALDDNYQLVRIYRAGNGYRTDGHDLQILDNGHYLILIYDLQTVDMSQIVEGGNPEAAVTGCLIQELDADENVIFEWRTWDHFDILDTNVDVTAKTIDYVHCNSVELDNDGHILLSSRHFDEVTKINRQTGDIIWRLGGKQNEFSYTGDVPFSHQHDARRLPDGRLTVYDNGNAHLPAHSRGLEIELDEEDMTATLIQEFRNTPDTYGMAMGNAQRLPNGNTVVGWGFSTKPLFTEFTAAGTKALEFEVADVGGMSYRAFRLPWQGYPSWPPMLVAEVNDLQVNLFFSWNGSTDVAGYAIFARDPKGQEMLLGQVDKEGFENTYSTQAKFPGPWTFWVAAKDKEGELLDLSDEVVLLPDYKRVYLPVVHSGSLILNK